MTGYDPARDPMAMPLFNVGDIDKLIFAEEADEGVDSVENPLNNMPEKYDERMIVVSAALTLMAREQLRLQEENEQLRQALAHSKNKAATDDLTGLLQRSAWFESVKQVIDNPGDRSTDDSQHSLLLLDIDHFKSINDEYGHPCGDEVLKTVAQRLRLQTRTEDIIGRHGGEEFIMFLPHTSPYDAILTAERLQIALKEQGDHDEERAQFPTELQRPVTMSIGVAVLDSTESLTVDNAVDEAIRVADAALYEAKRNGRNRVELGMPTTEQL